MFIAAIMMEMFLVATMEEQLGLVEAKYQLKPPEAYTHIQWYVANQEIRILGQVGIYGSQLVTDSTTN